MKASGNQNQVKNKERL